MATVLQCLRFVVCFSRLTAGKRVPVKEMLLKLRKKAGIFKKSLQLSESGGILHIVSLIVKEERVGRPALLLCWRLKK